MRTRKGSGKRLAASAAPVLLAGFALLACGILEAGEPAAAPPPSPAGPQEVTVGLFVNQITELSLKEGYLVVDMYVWFRWKDAALKPYESFGIIDGLIESRGEPFSKTLPDGTLYAYLQIRARITKYWDISDYPLDDHTVEIIVEEENSEDHLIRYAADAANSGIGPRVILPGWRVSAASTEAGLGVYRSNFGDLTLPPGNESRYGRLTFNMEFHRKGWSFFTKTFFGVWIAAAIAFLVFFIKPIDVDPRFGLAVGALFTAIASEYIVVSSLPDTNSITLADKLHIVAFFSIFVAVAQSTVSLWLAENDKVALSKKLDRVFGFAVPLAYIAFNVLFTVTR
jgi:hypothetical protein